MAGSLREVDSERMGGVLGLAGENDGLRQRTRPAGEADAVGAVLTN